MGQTAPAKYKCSKKSPLAQVGALQLDDLQNNIMESLLNYSQLVLGLGQMIAAFVVARFTKQLAEYTAELAQAQKMSNSVLKEQTALLDRQTQLHEAQQRLQEQLAESEVRPLLALQAAPHGLLRLTLTNLGRFGVLVVKLKQYRERPNVPDSDSFVGTPAGQGKQRFPLPLPAGASERLSDSEFDPSRGQWIEVVYEDGASGHKRSDLWKYTGQYLGFVREWWAEEVPPKTQSRG